MKIKLDTGEILKSDGIVTDAQGNELGYLVYCRMDRCFPITWICPKDRVVEAIEEDSHEFLVFGKYDPKTASLLKTDKEDESHINYIITLLEDKKKEYTDSGKKNIEKEIDWLKSLKIQQNQYDKGYNDGYSAAKYNQWKPTDKQMEDFRMLLDYNIGVFDYAKFMSADSLYEDLKKNLID